MRRSLTAVALFVLLLTACTTSGPPSTAPSSPAANPTQPGESHPGTIGLTWNHGLLPGVSIPKSGAVFISPTRLAFVTAGSGSCPSLPTSLDVLGPNTIRLHVSPYDANKGACTTDLSTTTVEVAIDPTRVDVGHDLKIQLVYALGAGRTPLVAPGLG